jgi:hypothetical protein
MFEYFFSLILLNVFISLVASKAGILPNNTKAVKFRSHEWNPFPCLERGWSGYYDLIFGLHECQKTAWQMFYIDNLKHINDKLKPHQYPITKVTYWNPVYKDNFTVLENVRFEKFDDITWFIVNAKGGEQCLTYYVKFEKYLNRYVSYIGWMDCAKDEKNFPKHPSQRWDIENWE